MFTRAISIIAFTLLAVSQISTGASAAKAKVDGLGKPTSDSYIAATRLDAGASRFALASAIQELNLGSNVRLSISPEFLERGAEVAQEPTMLIVQSVPMSGGYFINIALFPLNLKESSHALFARLVAHDATAETMIPVAGVVFEGLKQFLDVDADVAAAEAASKAFDGMISHPLKVDIRSPKPPHEPPGVVGLV